MFNEILRNRGTIYCDTTHVSQVSKSAWPPTRPSHQSPQVQVQAVPLLPHTHDSQPPPGDRTKNTRRRWRRHINNNNKTTTALTQQPAWDSRSARTDTLRAPRAIDHRRHTVDCRVVASCGPIIVQQPNRPITLLCCKITNPAHIVYPTNRPQYYRDTICGHGCAWRLFVKKKCEYYYVIYYDMLKLFLSTNRLLSDLFFILYTLTEFQTTKLHRLAIKLVYTK